MSEFGRALVTGGAGFIGSHVVDWLAMEGTAVTVYDNFSTGREAFLDHHRGGTSVSVVRGDVLDLETLARAVDGQDIVFHFQANADVRGGIHHTSVDVQQNMLGTWNVLEAMRRQGVKRIVFASSATVYGEPEMFPTPENCALIQTSLYGASKLAGEAMIQAYCEYYDFQSWTFRFVSWIGERYTHGVIFDLAKKLRVSNGEIDLLGDGRQRKSYLDVRDGLDALCQGIRAGRAAKNIFNVGHDGFMTVVQLADIVAEEMDKRGTRYRFAGGERGWPGDSPFVHLDTTQLKRLGWRPRISIEDGIRTTVRYLMAHDELFNRG